MSGHTPWTPGPWELTHVSGKNFAVQRFEIRGMFGDSPNTYPIFNKETSEIDGGTVCMKPANARLIAAAPEMAEALRALVAIEPSNADDDPEQAAAFRNARTLLAKIGGAA